MRKFFKQLFEGAGELAFPPVCVACHELVEASGFTHLCERCAGKLDFVAEPSCTVCGHPFYGVLAGERMCPHCEGLRPAFNRGRTVLLCKGPARALVHELKYHRALHVLADIEKVFRRSPHVLDFIRDGILIPVPLHPRKTRERGYNQSVHLAELLARTAGGSTSVAAILRRIIDTASQTAFDRQARRTNLKNAFALARGAVINPGHHYILVDDVFTTGSTLNSCAAVLRRAGCLNLDVVTFGHG